MVLVGQKRIYEGVLPALTKPPERVECRREARLCDVVCPYAAVAAVR